MKGRKAVRWEGRAEFGSHGILEQTHDGRKRSCSRTATRSGGPSLRRVPAVGPIHVSWTRQRPGRAESGGKGVLFSPERPARHHVQEMALLSAWVPFLFSVTMLTLNLVLKACLFSFSSLRHPPRSYCFVKWCVQGPRDWSRWWNWPCR